MLFRLINKRQLVRVDKEAVAADATDIIAQFELNVEFTAEDTRAFWRRSDTGKTYDSLLDAEGKTLIPWEVLTASENPQQWPFSYSHTVFVGLADNDRTTAAEVEFNVALSGYREETENTKPPTQSTVEQLIASQTPQFAIGEVEKLPAGSDPTVEMTGTVQKPVLNFGIPAGGAGGGEVSAESIKNALGYTPADASSVPTNTSHLTNDSGYITKAVTDLVNYYTKSQTYTKDEVNNLVSAVPKFSIQVVSSLPTTNISSTTVYLLKSGDESDNLYTEYIYVDGAWEYLGKQTVDLSGYALKTDIPTKLSALADDVGYITQTALNNALSGYAKKATTLAGYGITDGATSEQFQQLSKEKADYDYVDNAVKGATAPAYAETISDMKDTSKVYLGSNGNIWAYTAELTAKKTNQYKADTAQFNVRYNNGSMSTTRGFVLVEVDGLDFTGKSEYIVRFSGATLVRHTNMGVYGQVTFFAGSEFSSTKWIYSTANSSSIAFAQDDNGYYVDLMDAAPAANVTRCYFAICLADNTNISAANCENLFIEFVPLTTYVSEYKWRDTGIQYANYVMTDADTTAIADKLYDYKVVYVDCETGSDTNKGGQNDPFKTIQTAIDSGAKTIYCKAGTYNEAINLNNVHGVRIIGQWEGYESGSRPKVRIDHSTTLTPFDGGDGLKTVDLPSETYKNQHPLLYNVFVTKNYAPTYGSGATIIYTVSMWNVTDDRVSAHYKLVPVMTLEECQSTEETFFYDGTTLYIHSTGSTFKMVSTSKINKVENCSDIVFEDVAFDYCYYDALAVNNSNGIIFRNCEFSHSSRSHGLAAVNMNGELYNCEAYRNCTDGLNFHDFGETTVYNCIGAYNQDDGISHHDGCTGSIHGGQYHHNGKGGVSSPTYGAVIDIYNVIMHDNQYGIYVIGEPADRQIMVNGCYIHHNTYGIASPKYDLLVIHSTITDNSTDTSGNVTVVSN